MRAIELKAFNGATVRDVGASSVNGCYITGNFTAEGAFQANTPITICRDHFLNHVHRTLATAPEVHIMLTTTKDIEVIPSLMPYFLPYVEFREPVFEVVKIKGSAFNINGICFKFSRNYYIDPSLFWIITEEFRHKICGITKVDRTPGGWYFNSTGSPYSGFKASLGHLHDRVKDIPVNDVDILGFNSPMQVTNYMSSIVNSAIYYLSRCKQSGRKGNIELKTQLVHLKNQIDSMRTIHPALFHLTIAGSTIESLHSFIHQLDTGEIKYVPVRK